LLNSAACCDGPARWASNWSFPEVPVSLRPAGVAFRIWQAVTTLPPLQLLLVGYASYVLLGACLLCLPWCQAAPGATLIDHLFTATSAVSTTGLVTVSTSDTYSFGGELLVMLMIQLGGLGYMTVSSFLLLAVSGDLSTLRHKVARQALSLPQGFDVRGFLKLVIGFTLVIELLGAVALYPAFVAHGSQQPVWDSVFHSVSAFCTAGFGLRNNSFEDYRSDIWMNVVISTLAFLGAIGFIVLHDAWKSWRDRKRQATLTTRIILWSTIVTTVAGTILFALEEPLVRGMPWWEQWMTSLFQVLNAGTTTGFNTIPIGGLSMSSVILLWIAMVIGASPAGTGGGLKTTTCTALWAEMLSVLRGRSQTVFFGRTIPEPRMRAAVASAVFYMLTLAAGTYGLSLLETSTLVDQAFECASALGTVGLSRGITGTLTPEGKLLVTLLMFIGRVGPLAIGMALFAPPTGRGLLRHPEEDVIV
jgi:trk system potassium uptake protein TrkH